MINQNLFSTKRTFSRIRTSAFLFLILFTVKSFGQLTNGSVAPDFTLTDYYGTSHNLYSYLNSGKTVFLEIFAAHCPTCWSYHQTHRLRNMYNQYGPSGSNEIMVLALEHDQWNDSNAFIGNGPPWVTQGNWLADTPFPIFDVEDPFRTVFTDYNVTGYPIIYKICPDKILERVLTSETEAILYQKVQNCQVAMGLVENKSHQIIYYDSNRNVLVLPESISWRQLRIVSIDGKFLKQVLPDNGNIINLNDLAEGVYLYEVIGTGNNIKSKFFVN